MSNVRVLLFVVLVITWTVFTVSNGHKLCNRKIHGRKILLDNRVIDTTTAPEEFSEEHNLHKPRQIHVHVQKSTQDVVDKLHKELESKIKPRYLPHNTYLTVTTLAKAKEAKKKLKDIISWISEVPQNQKVSQELQQELEHASDDPVLEVLVHPVDGMTVNDVAGHWMQELKKRNTPAHVVPISKEKLSVIPVNPKDASKISNWIAIHQFAVHLQRKESFSILRDETAGMTGLFDNPRIVANMDPLSDEYKQTINNVAQMVEAKRDSREWVGQTALPDVQLFWSKGLDGEGEILGIGDTGIDYNNCFFHDSNGTVPFNKVDLNAHRKFVSYWTYADNKDAYMGHGTHVSSIAVGQSTAEQQKFNGIVHKAKVSFFDIGLPDLSLRLPDDLAEEYFPKFYKSTPITSNSWGNKRFGQYTLSAREIDDFSHTHKDFLAIFAAGNSGRSGSRTLTPPGTAKNALTVGAAQGTHHGFQMGLPLYADLLKRQIRQQMCGDSAVSLSDSSGLDMQMETLDDICSHLNSTKDCCSHGSVKKFCCVEYMLEQLKQHPEYYSPDNVATFSSRGPTKDNRLKPDILAHGQPVFGARSDGTSSKYHCPIPLVMQGTSQAAPIIAGYAIMARQYYRKGFYPTGMVNPKDGFTPSGALLKATLINSGTNLPGMVDLNGAGNWAKLKPIPSYTQGFGRVHLSTTLPFHDVSNFTLFKDEASVSTNDKRELCFQIQNGATKDFKATLVWMDYPGSPSAAITLVNNLDLRVISNKGKTFLGNGKIDHLNNVEQVTVTADSLDSSYKIIIEGKHIPHGPQDYALVVTGQFAPVSCSEEHKGLADTSSDLEEDDEEEQQEVESDVDPLLEALLKLAKAQLKKKILYQQRD